MGWPLQLESRSAAGSRTALGLPAVSMGDGGHHRQPEATAAATATAATAGRALARVASAPEGLEDLRREVAWNARAIVLHTQMTPAMLHAGLDPDRTGHGVLACIFQQGQQSLPNAERVVSERRDPYPGQA